MIVQVQFVLPAVVIICSLGGSAIYVARGEWVDAVYWLLGAGLNACMLLKRVV